MAFTVFYDIVTYVHTP